MAGANITLSALLAYKSRNFINVPGDSDLCFEKCIVAHFYKYDVEVRTLTDEGKKKYKALYEKGKEKLEKRGFKFDDITHPFDLK